MSSTFAYFKHQYFIGYLVSKGAKSTYSTFFRLRSLHGYILAFHMIKLALKQVLTKLAPQWIAIACFSISFSILISLLQKLCIILYSYSLHCSIYYSHFIIWKVFLSIFPFDTSINTKNFEGGFTLIVKILYARNLIFV